MNCKTLYLHSSCPVFTFNTACKHVLLLDKNKVSYFNKNGREE